MYLYLHVLSFCYYKTGNGALEQQHGSALIATTAYGRVAASDVLRLPFPVAGTNCNLADFTEVAAAAQCPTFG